jgi:hypothetical protein
VRAVYHLSNILDITYESEMRFTLSEIQIPQGLGFCFKNVDSDIITGQQMSNCFVVQNGNIPDLSDTNILRKINGNEIYGDKVNLALRKPSEQSGVYGPGDASRAVDGGSYSFFDYDIWSKNTGKNRSFHP